MAIAVTMTKNLHIRFSYDYKKGRLESEILFQNEAIRKSKKHELVTFKHPVWKDGIVSLHRYDWHELYIDPGYHTKLYLHGDSRSSKAVVESWLPQQSMSHVLPQLMKLVDILNKAKKPCWKINKVTKTFIEVENKFDA